MRLTGLHLLLTYQYTLECEHCFVWGSPWQTGTMTLDTIRRLLQQADDLGTVEWVYFEGGEPFLYYAVLVRGIEEAAARGYRTGIVSNAYWATDVADAVEWLRPFAGLIEDLSVSSDLYHWSEQVSQQARNAAAAAEQLGIPVGYMSVAQPEATGAPEVVGQLPLGESAVMYRGRAAEMLVDQAGRQPWQAFTTCPYEDLREPGRLHVDPFGHLHICQGISLGNFLDRPLREICAGYDPKAHPISGPLLAGGPAELVRRYGLAHKDGYADACHLCFEARRSLRGRFPEILTPDQMYALAEGG